jgi:hypothetical protein
MMNGSNQTGMTGMNGMTGMTGTNLKCALALPFGSNVFAAASFFLCAFYTLMNTN